jgi:hypothetical protein
MVGRHDQGASMTDHWCKYCNGMNTHNCQFNTDLPRMKIYTTNVSDNEALLRQALERLRAEVERLAEVLSKILENEASDWKAAEEFGGYVLDDELREEARAALRERLGEKA